MAMYVPSLFSGFIVDRFGPKNLTIIGTLSMGAAVAINLLSAGFTSYLVALIALGLGWNFLFVGGSFLLSQSYYPRERFKAQAVNEFSIFAVQAIATLSAGTVIGLAGWRVVNFIALPVLLPALVVLLVFKPPLNK
jgi:MFS family permease